jgi:catechol 2,3-dioxygenase-like lactoylglutathione lyase family enzyme
MSGPLCLDHITLHVADVPRAVAFYRAALAPLDIALAMEAPGGVAAGFGVAGKPSFWIAPGGPTTPPVHVCFRAQSRAAVDRFHAAALAAGATDNGAPGVREHYRPDYYAAFVRDPESHNIEAVCFV